MRLHNRVVKADFWRDTELIRELPIAGRMLYQGLWQLADDSGCVLDDAWEFKLYLFPLDADVTPQDIQRWRDILVRLGKLIPYEAEGKACLYLKNFHKHQSLRSPGPPESAPLPPWVQWHPSDKSHRSGTYTVGEPYGNRTDTVRPGNSVVTDTNLEPKNLEPKVINNSNNNSAHAREADPADARKVVPIPHAWVSAYAERFCRAPSASAQAEIADLVAGGVQPDLIAAAMDDAAENGAEAPDTWMAKKLAIWYSYGLRTAADLEEWRRNKASKRQQNRGRDSPGTLNAWAAQTSAEEVARELEAWG